MTRMLLAAEPSIDSRPLERWRMVVIAAATLLLCSCQTLHQQPAPKTEGRAGGAAEMPTDQTAESHASTHAMPRVTHSSRPPAASESPRSRGGEQASRPPSGNSPLDQQPAAEASTPPTPASQIALADHTVPSVPPRRSGGRAAHRHAAHPPAAAPTPATLPPSAFGATSSHDLLPGQASSPLEFVCDGGDRPPPALVEQDWTVLGLEGGDAIVHYDTLDGDTEVEPSNKVCLYAPRFAAVRKVYGTVQHRQHQSGAGVRKPVGPHQSAEVQPSTTVVQPLQPGRSLALRSATGFRDRTRGTGLENLQAAAGAETTLAPYEDFLIIRRGQFDSSEKARLAKRLSAAVSWTHDSAVQVVIDNETAVESSQTVGAESIYTYESPPGKPCLRVVKIASRKHAQPGDLVEFTLRFDNVGNETIGNVTVIDNLVTRLEYVPDSQSASLPAEFSTDENEHQSLTLRWELEQPLEVGEGGIVRFQCQVR